MSLLALPSAPLSPIRQPWGRGKKKKAGSNRNPKQGQSVARRKRVPIAI